MLQGSSFRLALWLNRYSPRQTALLVVLKGSFRPDGPNSRLEASYSRGVPTMAVPTAVAMAGIVGAFVFFNGFHWLTLPILIVALLGLIRSVNRTPIPRQRVIDALHAYLGQQAPQPPVPPVPMRVTGRDLVFGLLVLGPLDAVCALRLWKFQEGTGARTVIWGIALLSAVTWLGFFLRWLRQPAPPSPES